jgi:mannose-6-phosphate isomerase
MVLSPHLAPRIWGGHTFGQGIGEAWDLSAHPNGPSIVNGGEHGGATLTEVVAASPDAFGGPIGLLAKRLDCAEDLSVQVHPAEGDPKTEAWVVLDAAPGAAVYVGFSCRRDRGEVETAALDGSIMDLLAFHPVARGDCLLVPAGTVHAIGGGLQLFELQQSSDTTFRLYDYGRGRELHLDEGLAVADLGPSAGLASPTLLPDGHRLVSCTHFHIDDVEGDTINVNPGEQWSALFLLAGSATVGAQTAPAGSTILVPAAAGTTQVHGPCRALRYGPGPT